MRSFKVFLTGLVLLGLGALCAVQVHSLRDTKARVAALETRIAEWQGKPVEVDATDRPDAQGAVLDFGQRLARLENTMSQPRRVTNNARGSEQPRMSASALEELRRKLLDPAVADKDKLQALRGLRRNKALSDDMLQGALSWLQSSQDGALRREIFQQLDGVTNAALRQPLLDLAATSTDPKLRQQAVENLRDFVADADVEKRLWEIMAKDPEGKVREQAEEALRKGPMTPERIASLQQRAANPETPIDEKITAMKALQKGGVDVADTAMALAQLAPTTQDVVTRAQIFQALDGIHDPRLLAPLVGGLQDPSPDVRMEATEALRGFASNPNIRQWLEYVAQSDTDSRVKREAFQALKKLQEGPR